MTTTPTPRQRRRAWLDMLTRDEDVFILLGNTLQIYGGMDHAHRFHYRTATEIHLDGRYKMRTSFAGKDKDSHNAWIVSRQTALRISGLHDNLAAVRRALKETGAFVEWTSANGWGNATPRSALAAAQGTAERIVADIKKAAREAGIPMPRAKKESAK